MSNELDLGMPAACQIESLLLCSPETKKRKKLRRRRMHPETHTHPERNKINKTPKANGSERPRKFVL
jgi:hypothetical protein